MRYAESKILEPMVKVLQQLVQNEVVHEQLEHANEDIFPNVRKSLASHFFPGLLC